MARSSDTSVSLEASDTRSEAMHSAIESWIDDLVHTVQSIDQARTRSRKLWSNRHVETDTLVASISQQHIASGSNHAESYYATASTVELAPTQYPPSH